MAAILPKAMSRAQQRDDRSGHQFEKKGGCYDPQIRGQPLVAVSARQQWGRRSQSDGDD
ncbi:hypothetical protein ABIA25_004942 [Sinorhizobium fredii]|uniref:hypothetical protein n=1 Tax=Rhizobium fredii TaxID=380 RepID=UPI0035141149